jgi:hypothetical protein
VDSLNLLFIETKRLLVTGRTWFESRKRSESGGISIEYALIATAVLIMAGVIAVKIKDLGSQAEDKLPESLNDETFRK